MASLYQIRCDGFVLADNLQEDYAFYNGKLSERINEAGTLEFTLVPSNPRLADVHLLTSTISLYRDGAEYWRGRVIRAESDYRNNVHFTCEGALAFLYDVRLQGASSGTSTIIISNPTTIRNTLSGWITSYNGYCSTNRQYTLGVIEPSEITVHPHSSEFWTVFEIFAELLESTNAYYSLEYAEGGNVTLNFLNVPTEPSGQIIRFQTNLLDLTKYIDGSKIITALYATNGAGTYLTTAEQNQDLVDAFGLIYGYETLDGYSNASSLRQGAADFLAKNVMREQSITLTATDLSLVHVDVAPFEVGQMVRIISPPHAIDTGIMLTEKETDLNDPAATKITLGSTQTSLTGYVRSNIKKGYNSLINNLAAAYSTGVNLL